MLPGARPRSSATTGRARRGPRSSRAAPSGTREGAALVYSGEGRLCKVQYESCFDKEMFVSGEMSAIRGQFTGLLIQLFLFFLFSFFFGGGGSFHLGLSFCKKLTSKDRRQLDGDASTLTRFSITAPLR